jgi:hypothetical protein
MITGETRFVEYNARMETRPRVAPWLWRTANWGLLLAALGVAALALALARGAADPPHAGPLLWQDDFRTGLIRWTPQAPEGGQVETIDGALSITLPAITGGLAWMVTDPPAGDFTLEVAGAALEGGGAYGLVFGWQDAERYSAVLVNGAGYAEAYTQSGITREPWFAWQQWPHLLFGPESNRVRVDVRAAATGVEVTARVNDERLATTTLAGNAGQVGILARATEPARLVFSWVRIWAAD